MKAPKTRNGGQWSEARFNGFIKSLLRKGTMRWGPVNATKKEAWVERGKYLCAGCDNVVPLTLDKKRNVFVDHKVPATDVVEGFTTWDDFIEGLFCEEDNLQVLCRDCHDKKSKAEAELRRKNKDWPSLTPEYNSWRAMRARCLFKSHKAYKNYGGRGIKICDRWVDSFENFCEDMGDRPEGTTLDRIDVNGGYNKENCRWADPTTQGNNRRDNVYLEFDGNCKTLSQWSKELDISVTTIRNRLGAGYLAEEALSKDFEKTPQVKSKMSEKDFIDHFNKATDIDDLVSRTGRCKSTCISRAQKLGLKFNKKE